jgi:hypothetical protein
LKAELQRQQRRCAEAEAALKAERGVLEAQRLRPFSVAEKGGFYRRKKIGDIM